MKAFARLRSVGEVDELARTGDDPHVQPRREVHSLLENGEGPGEVGYRYLRRRCRWIGKGVVSAAAIALLMFAAGVLENY